MEKILFFSSRKYDKFYFNKINKKYKFKIHFVIEKLNKKNVFLAKNYNHICIFVNDNAYDPYIIKLLKKFNIKTIALRCTGINNVNIKLAKKYNIKVINVKAYSPESIAEYTIGLILNLSRKIHHAFQYTRNKNFILDDFIGFNINKKTIGIIGTGQIGKLVIKILKGFNVNIIAFDIIKSKEIENIGVKYTSLKTLYENSDIISLHCPYTKKNHHMINKNIIKLFKKNIMLINTSRGELLNSIDVINGIKEKKIGYLGLDVYENEKEFFFKNNFNKIIKDDNLNILLSYNNVLITSHQAFLTKEALLNIAKITLKNIKKISINKECKDLIY